MKTFCIRLSCLFVTLGPLAAMMWNAAFAYPPAVGLTSKSTNCLACHANNGPWSEDRHLIIDVIDEQTKESLREPDGTFLVKAKRGERRTVLTVIGRAAGDSVEAPYRNGWIYVDPKAIANSSLDKFAPGWEVNLPMACRLVGDSLQTYAGARITVLPMTVAPTDKAQDSELELQIMLTRGEPMKGKPKEGLVGSYFERTIRLRVVN